MVTPLPRYTFWLVWVLHLKNLKGLLTKSKRATSAFSHFTIDVNQAIWLLVKVIEDEVKWANTHEVVVIGIGEYHGLTSSLHLCIPYP
jgi:hypothetical protein